MHIQNLVFTQIGFGTYFQNNEKGLRSRRVGKIRHDFADVQMPVGDAQIIT